MFNIYTTAEVAAELGQSSHSIHWYFHDAGFELDSSFFPVEENSLTRQKVFRENSSGAQMSGAVA